LIALYADVSYDFILFPVITGSIMLILISFLINKFILEREYPKKRI
jgi:CBS-domain-containing membrane protein